MNDNLFRMVAICVGIGLAAPAAPAGLVAEEASRPNIIYIMADDHAAHALGAYGGRLAALNPTPTLDRLSKEGMLLENCFCVNSICSPSRATILTGQHSHINGVTRLGGKVEEDQQHLPRLMKEAGYQTAIIGKWHLKIQPLAFDYYKVLPGQGKYHDPELRERRAPDQDEVKVQEQGHSSDVITDSAIAWLKGRDRSRPFFLMHHFKAPHGPWDHAERYDSLWEDTDIPEPASLWKQPAFGSIATRGHADELLFNIGSSIGPRNRFRNQVVKLLKDVPEDLSNDEVTRLSYQTYLKKYLRCVRGVDDNIQRMIDYLEEDGILDDTVIVYSSDQGMMLGEHDYIDKRWMYEESLRMPLVVRYPKAVGAGTRSDAIVNNTDFAPTLLDFAGVATPAFMQGRSFRSILETGREPADWRQATYYRYWMHMVHHYNPAHFGIRTKDYKLIFYYAAPENEKEGANRRTPPGWELYDMKNDPKELNNLYGNPEYAGVVKKLKKDLLALRQKVKDSDADRPHIQPIIDQHWDGGEEEAIRISHDVAANPVNAKPARQGGRRK